MSAFKYRTCCVQLSLSDVPALHAMIDRSRAVSYRTFRRRCPDLPEIADQLGYARHPSRGLTLSRDWYVGYYRSRFRGQPCYYMTHSAIEYIWLPTGKPRGVKP